MPAAGNAIRWASMQKYRTIVADPPWKYGKWGKASENSIFAGSVHNVDIALPYPSMSLAEIAALPIPDLAEADCELYVWTTQKYLPHTFPLLEKWGFKYCETLTWCKEPRGTGQGGLFTPTTEFIVHGRIGKMPKKQRIDSTWWKVARPNVHSRKPESFQDIIEQVSDMPRLEMFARRYRLGWDSWGNEIGSHVEIPLRSPTPHAPDVGDSAASSGIFLPSEVSALQGESTPAPTQVM